MKVITTVRIIMVKRKKSAFYTHQEVPIAFKFYVNYKINQPS